MSSFIIHGFDVTFETFYICREPIDVLKMRWMSTGGIEVDTRCCKRSRCRRQHRATEGVCVEDLEEWQGESECVISNENI